MFKKLTWQLFFQFVSCYSDKLRLLKRGIFKYSQSSNRGSHDVPQIWRPWGRVHCFLRQIHFRVPLLLLLPLLAIAFHWNLKKNWYTGFVCSSVLFYPIFLQYRSILIKLASLTLATAFSRQIRRRLVGVFAQNSVYVPSTSRFSLKRSFRQYVWLPLNNAWFAHSMLPCVCLLVILRDDRKMWLEQKKCRVCHWCFYPILTTSAIF